MNKITLGLEGRVAENRGPREGPAREAGTQGRERAASGEVAAAEAWEPHGHGHGEMPAMTPRSSPPL